MFSFPNDYFLQAQWVELILRSSSLFSSWLPGRDSSICSKDFCREDFTNLMHYESKFASRLILKANAVPFFLIRVEENMNIVVSLPLFPCSSDCVPSTNKLIAIRDRKALTTKRRISQETLV